MYIYRLSNVDEHSFFLIINIAYYISYNITEISSMYAT
jgi:hypothetical protein